MKQILLLAVFFASCSPGPTTTSMPLAAPWSPQDVQVTVMGFESATFDMPKGEPELVAGLYDAIIVGGGMSGLTSCWYLKDKKVVVLERAKQLGGLAHRGATGDGIAYGRGSAYYSEPPENVMVWYKEMGLTPIEQTVIPSPIDSYF